MTRLEWAAAGFDVVTAVAKLMREAHQRHSEWESTIEMKVTDDPLPKPTGGYEIHIIIHPPKKNYQEAFSGARRHAKSRWQAQPRKRAKLRKQSKGRR